MFIASILYRADLEAVTPVLDKLDTIVLPKVDTAEDVAFVDNYLSTKGNDINNRIKILACIESAKGVMNLKQICQAPRVDGLIVRVTREPKYVINVSNTTI